MTATTSPSVLMRCDGSPQLGLGHVVRCLALADELRETHGCRVSFAMRFGPLGIGLVQEKGFPVVTPNGTRRFSYPAWMEQTVHESQAQVLVLDVRDDLSRAAIESLRGGGTHIVTVDDPSERRLAADMAFYPPVPQTRRLSWDGFTGQLFVGWEWVVVRREFGYHPPAHPNDPLVVLITMGGSDPAGLTLKAVEALDLLLHEFDARIVIGPGFLHRRALTELLRRSRRTYECVQSPRDMARLMASADLAIASFGVTAYELAAMGVPAIYLCLTDDHAVSAGAFVEAGIAKSLGVHTVVSDQELRTEVLRLLASAELRWHIAARASELVDGRGAGRVAETLLQCECSVHVE